MTLDAPRAIPDHEAMDDTASWACPQPDMSCCAPEFLAPPDAPSKRADRLATLFFLALILLLWLLGAWLDS